VRQCALDGRLPRQVGQPFQRRQRCLLVAQLYMGRRLRILEIDLFGDQRFVAKRLFPRRRSGQVIERLLVQRHRALHILRLRPGAGQRFRLCPQRLGVLETAAGVGIGWWEGGGVAERGGNSQGNGNNSTLHGKGSVRRWRMLP